MQIKVNNGKKDYKWKKKRGVLPSMLKIVEKLPLCHITLVAFKHHFTCVSNERPYNKEIVKALHKNVIVLYCHVL